jgi:predicted peptidase
MKLISIPILALLAFSSLAAADTGFLDRAITFQGNTYSYQVYVPANYTPDKPWPVILYLHGNEHQGADGMRQTNAPIASALREHRDWFPAVVVFPQAQPDTSWIEPAMQELALAELDKTVSEFHGDPRRIYLTGFSMGASGTYCIAYHHPERFAALLVVAGRVQPGPRYTAQRTAIDRKTNAFAAAPDPFAALASAIKEMPIWMFHGDSDQIVDVDQSRRLAAALKQQGAEVKYFEYPKVDHLQAAVRVYFTPAIYEWLLQQQRK